MPRAASKHDRLIQIENLLLSHPEGLTQAEIARRVGVNRSTILRDIPSFSKSIYLDEDGRWKVDLTADLIHIRLNLHEALAIHLAARLLATRMDRQNPHGASALRKLAVALQRWAALISQHIEQSAESLGEATQINDPVYLQSLERLTLAWAEQRKARIWHRSERTGVVSEYLFCPYFIEPYAIGQTTMLIGLCDPPGGLRTLKIERIERVEPLGERYEIPDDFDPHALLADAWGIWYTEEPPVEVVLRFSARVANRVRETRWHRSEQVSELEDGGLLWRARIAEPQEMIPWVRGWGSDCEVIEPEKLRQTLIEEVVKLRALYGDS